MLPCLHANASEFTATSFLALLFARSLCELHKYAEKYRLSHVPLQVVATAAHCLLYNGVVWTPKLVVVGATDLRNLELNAAESFRVRRAIVHPRYLDSNGNSYDDLALLVLDGRCSKPPAKLPVGKLKLRDGKRRNQLWTAGYRWESHHGHMCVCCSELHFIWKEHVGFVSI
jgi:hypothetical protein